MTGYPEDAVAISLDLSPTFNVSEVFESLITGFLTVILQVTLVLSQVAVIVASPGFMAVILPYSSIVAILFLLLLYVTV